jgi:hypothetical protein
MDGLDLSWMIFPALLYTRIDDGQFHTKVHGMDSAQKVKPLEPLSEKLFE